MKYAYQRSEGFVMITGRPGTGKTTLVNDLIHSIDKRQASVGMLVCTQLEAEDLLRMVADSFGLSSESNQKSRLLLDLTKLFTENYSAGKRSLLIIDEAQDLSFSAMEELRLLTNLQRNNRPLLQIFLLGQDELRDLVHKPNMEQVHQRLVAACHLNTLSEEDTKAYIKHRLKEAGWVGDPAISEAIYPVIHKFSGGIPRRINMICSRLLLHGCVIESHKLGIADAKEVLNEIKNEQLTSGEIPDDRDFEVEDRYEEVNTGNADGTDKKKHLKLASSAAPSSKAKTAIKNPFMAKAGAKSASAASAESENEAYTGPDRRQGHRRSGSDRREAIRFEPRTADRRQNTGRRFEDKIWGKFRN